MTPGTPQRLPALDGLRAISIALVIFGHLVGTRNAPLTATALHGAAGLGVRVFFVISGFLITTLIFAELDRTATISLRDFYVRRTYRIFPAFYAYLAVIGLLAAFDAVQLLENDMLAAATYTMNFHRPRAWHLGHLWSLSVEEQFYLLWPAIVLLARKRGAMVVAALALAAAPLIRVGVWVFMPAHRLGIGETFPTVFDALAAGCLLAGIRGKLAENRAYSAFARSWLFVLVPIVAVGAGLVPRVSFNLAVGSTLQNIGIALTVDWAVRRVAPSSRFAGKLLDARPLVWIGRLSYSLYLWQQPFVNREGTHWVQAWPFNLLAAVAMAMASYYLVEQPFLRLRERRARTKIRLIGAAVPQTPSRSTPET